MVETKLFANYVNDNDDKKTRKKNEAKLKRRHLNC